MEKFLTIDFEAANRYIYSPCSVSIYEFNSNKIIKKLSTLINPGDVPFDSKLVELHNITYDMVKNAPNIETTMRNISNIIDNNIIFAHNAIYDISKYLTGCSLNNLSIPNFEYADTLTLARQTWKKLINYKLDTISEFLNIDLNHHNADSDAIACGKVVLELLKYNDVNSFESLFNKLNYIKGFYDGSLNHAHINTYKKSTSKSISDYERIKKLHINTSINSLIAGKYFVFTGTLNIKRADAMKIVADKGGIPEGNVTKNTNYLVVGRDDYGNFKSGNKSNKMIKAEKLIQLGQDLQIINEDDFLDIIA